METRYHISPKTGGPALCRARFRSCSYEHFPTEAEAYEAIERSALEEAGGPVPEVQSREPTPSPPLGELRVADERKSDHYHYQELWLRDEAGNPTVYLKVNLLSFGEREDGTLGEKPGVVLCGVEINPEVRGKGYALSAIRRLKETYGAETVEFTGSFSEAGYAMFRKLQAEEARTGEKLVSIQHGNRITEPQEGQSYSFVQDWETERGKYRL